MSLPLILQTYPNHLDTGIPIGEQLEIIFDRGIDLEIAKSNVVLYGPDFDLMSGPDTAIWIRENRENPFFLRSPSLKGLVECSYQLVYLDNLNAVLVPQPNIVSEVTETTNSYRSKLVITPQNPLAPDASYKFHIIGNPDSANTGISSRTVFDVQESAVAGDGVVKNVGSYTGTAARVVNIKVTFAGDIGDAKYKWWYTDAGEGSAITGRVTSRRYRMLADGLQIRFEGDNFLVADHWTFNVEPREYLATSTTIEFSTNDGTYSEAPESPSTPATSVPPASTLASLTDSPVLEILEVEPPHGSTNLPNSTREITITFSNDLDPLTVTQETVRVFVYPVSGVFQGQADKKELNKKLTVVDNILTIEL